LLKEIVGMARSQVKPKLMLWLCVDALVRDKIKVLAIDRSCAFASKPHSG
jgi:hypothetical protein